MPKALQVRHVASIPTSEMVLDDGGPNGMSGRERQSYVWTISVACVHVSSSLLAFAFAGLARFGKSDALGQAQSAQATSPSFHA
jgi:hypothetical protein